MLINAKNLRDTTTAFTTVFNGAFSGYTPTGSAIAREVSSSTRSNDYRWLGKLKGMREWIGERELNNLSEFGYQITNKPFENTVEVDADDFEDDQIGIYSPGRPQRSTPTSSSTASRRTATLSSVTMASPCSRRTIR